MEPPQRRSSGMPGEYPTNDGTEVKGLSHPMLLWECVLFGQCINFKKMMAESKSTWIQKSAEKCPS